MLMSQSSRCRRWAAGQVMALQVGTRSFGCLPWKYSVLVLTKLFAYCFAPARLPAEEVYTLVEEESLKVLEDEDLHLPVREGEGSFFYGH